MQEDLDQVIAPGVESKGLEEKQVRDGDHGAIEPAGKGSPAGVEGAGLQKYRQVGPGTQGYVVDNLFLIVPDKAVMECGQVDQETEAQN